MDEHVDKHADILYKKKLTESSSYLTDNEISSELAIKLQRNIDGIITKVNHTSKPDDPIDNEYSKMLHKDIDTLIKKINKFTDKQKKAQEQICTYEFTNDSKTDEKEDGVGEKYLCLPNSNTAPDIYESVAEPREIDWSVTGPVMTQCIKDLESIQQLQEETDILTCQLKQLILEKSGDQSSAIENIEAEYNI